MCEELDGGDEGEKRKLSLVLATLAGHGHDVRALWARLDALVAKVRVRKNRHDVPHQEKLGSCRSRFFSNGPSDAMPPRGAVRGGALGSFVLTDAKELRGQRHGPSYEKRSCGLSRNRAAGI